MTKKQQFWIGNSIKAGNLFSQYTPRELQGLYHPSEMITIIREVEIRKIERLIESVWLARTARKFERRYFLNGFENRQDGRG
jgi:hypothetical protein